MRIDWLKRIYIAVIGLTLAIFVGWWAIISFASSWSLSDHPIDTDNMLILLLIALALILSSVVALLMANLINHLIFSRWLFRQQEYLQKIVNDFWTSISAASDWPRDEIGRALATSDGGRLLKPDFDKLHDNQRPVRRLRHDFQIVEWYNIAKFLYKLGRVCRDGGYIRIEEAVRRRYVDVRACIRLRLSTHTIKFAAPLLLFTIIWYVIFSILWSWTDTAVFSSMRLSSPDGGESLTCFANLPFNADVNTLTLIPACTAAEILTPFLWILGALLLAFLTLNLVQFFVRWFTEKSWTDFDDIIVGISSGPTSAILLAVGFHQAGASVRPDLVKILAYYWQNVTRPPAIRTLLIIVAVWFTVYVFNQILVLVLEKWATRTDQKTDDMFVRIIQVFGTFLIVAGGLGALLISYNDQLSDLGLDNILLPYSILVSVFTAILGYASQEAIQNFFGGVLLQVDKPFDVGERLVLESGELVDVREVGMRSTRVHNVRTNSEMSIPNFLMSSQIINNVSRPDVEQRLQIHVQIPHEGRNLMKAEAILWDIAYQEGEVDQMRVRASEVPLDIAALGRVAIQEELRRLETTYPKIRQTNVYRIIGGTEVTGEPIFPKVYRFLEAISDLRQSYKNYEPHYFGQLNNKSDKRLTKIIFPENSRTSYDDFREFDSLVWELIDRLATNIRAGSTLTNIRDETLKLLKRAGGVALNTSAEDEDKVIATLYQLIDQQFQKLPNVANQTVGSFSWSAFGDLITTIYHEDRYRESKRLQIIERIEQYYSRVSDELYAIGETFEDLRPELDRLRAELTKEPAISSEFRMTEDGASYIEISFSVFVTHLERQAAVVHKLNRAIVRRFQMAEIPFYVRALNR